MRKTKLKIKKSARWRILIVDGQPLLRRGLASMIDGESDLAVCGQAATRAEGLAALGGDLPDLVTIDISLQASDGLELIKDIRVRFPALPVLVISMHDESVYAERAFRAGAQGYVTKEEPGETILAALRGVLQGQKYISPRMVAWFAHQYLEGRPQGNGSLVSRLSDRELEVFRLLGEHKTRGEIGRFLNLSVKTVESYRAQIKEKLGLNSGAELLSRATRWVATGGAE